MMFWIILSQLWPTVVPAIQLDTDHAASIYSPGVLDKDTIEICSLIFAFKIPDPIQVVLDKPVLQLFGHTTRTGAIVQLQLVLKISLTLTKCPVMPAVSVQAH